MNEREKRDELAIKWRTEVERKVEALKEEEKKWEHIFFLCNHGMPYPNSLDVDLVKVGIDSYLDQTLMCLSCDEDGNAMISVDEIIESAIHFRTLPLNTGKAHGMWFNLSQMKALRHVLDVVIENAEKG